MDFLSDNFYSNLQGRYIRDATRSSIDDSISVIPHLEGSVLLTNRTFYENEFTSPAVVHSVADKNICNIHPYK